MGKVIWWIVGGVVVGTAAIASTVVLWAQRNAKKPAGQKKATPEKKEGAEKAAA